MTVAVQVETTSSEHVRGMLMVAISGMLYGMIGYFGMQLIMQNLSVPVMLFWRFIIAALWMLLMGMLSQKQRLLRPKKIRSLLQHASIGALGYSGCSYFYYLSSIHIGTGPAMVLFYGYPVFVMFFAAMFSQWRFNIHALLSLAFVMTGLILLNGRGEYNLSTKGIILGITAGMSYAVYVFHSEQSTKKIDSNWLTFLICLFSAMIFLIISLRNGTFVIPHSINAWADILILGVIATAIPIQLLLVGLKHVSPVKASILSLLEPIVTVIVGMTFLHEKISSMQAVGIAIIIFGALVIQFEDKPGNYDLPLK